MQFRNTCIDGKSLKERKGMINTKFKMVLKSKGKRDDGKGENAIGEVNIGDQSPPRCESIRKGEFEDRIWEQKPRPLARRPDE